MQKVRKGPSWGPSQLGNMVHTWVQKPDPDGKSIGPTRTCVVRDQGAVYGP